MGKYQQSVIKMKMLFMVIILVFTYLILASDAARLRHLLVTTDKHPSALEEQIQASINHIVPEEKYLTVDGRRIDIEDIAKNDYPGSGANNRHDPRTPGKV